VHFFEFIVSIYKDLISGQKWKNEASIGLHSFSMKLRTLTDLDFILLTCCQAVKEKVRKIRNLQVDIHSKFEDFCKLEDRKCHFKKYFQEERYQRKVYFIIRIR
jgi:hypothetical protein